MRRLIPLLLLLLIAPLHAQPGIQTWIDFLGPEARAWEALTGNGSASYTWQGSALTASTNTVYFHLLSPARWVRWVLVWNPQGNSTAGVQIAHMDDGPTHLTPIAEITGSTAATPIVSAVVLTSAWNALVGGSYKHLGMQTRGSPVVFRCVLEVVY
jgi:hypothetical protein